MKYKVFHLTVPSSENDSGLSYRPNAERIAEAFSGKLRYRGITYDPVAYVEAVDLDAAYCLTNHFHDNWAKNAEVTLYADSPIRSTSIGDVIVDCDGVAYFVDRFGFSKVWG